MIPEKLYCHKLQCSGYNLAVTVSERGLWAVEFVDECDSGEDEQLTNNDVRAVWGKAAKQLQEYLKGQRHKFLLSLCFLGSEWQQAVWKKLVEIPYGQTMSYGEIAIKLGRPKSARAVGAACRTNPLAIVVPCHRVLNRLGELHGYAGGLDMKKKLLQLEGVRVS